MLPTIRCSFYDYKGLLMERLVEKGSWNVLHMVKFERHSFDLIRIPAAVLWRYVHISSPSRIDDLS